jgi:hypothetical protein
MGERSGLWARIAMTESVSTTFSMTSTTSNTTMVYHRFSDAASDVVSVRVYQGIHFRSADEVARRQGSAAADWAFSHFLRPME